MGPAPLPLSIRRAAAGLAAGLILCGTLSAHAQDAGTQSVQGPFTAVARQYHWAQRIAPLFNQTNEAIDLLVTCPANDPTLGRMEYGRRLTLPPKSRLQTPFAFRPGAGDLGGARPHDPKRFVVQAPISAFDAQTGQRLTFEPGKATLLAVDALAVGMIASETYAHDITSFIGDESRDGVLKGAYRLNDVPANCPDQWYGYDLLDILILRNVRAGDLTACQTQAIIDWTQRGGTLVLTGSDALRNLLAGPLGELAGVSCLDLDWTDQFHVAGLREEISITLDWPLPRVQLLASQADVLYTADALPLVTRQTVGNGQCFVFAMPLGAFADPALSPVWRQLETSLMTVPPVDPAAFAQAARETLRDIEGRPAPSRLVPFVILASLAGGTLVFGAVLGHWRRGEWLWVLLVPVAAILGGGLYALSRLGDDPQRLTHVGLISDFGNGSTQTQALMSYFSGPESGEMDFHAGTPRGVVQPILAEGTPGMEIQRIRTTPNGLTLIDRPIRPKETTGLYVDAMMPLRAADTRVSFGPEGAMARINNALDAPIEDSVLYVHGRSFAAGTVAGGESQTFVIDNTRRLGRREFSSSIVPNQRRNRLIERLLAEPGLKQHVADWPLFVGYTPVNPLRVLPGQTLHTQGWSVVISRIAWQAPPSGQTALIPVGFTDRLIHNVRTPLYNVQEDSFLETPRNGLIGLSIRPPEGSFQLADASAQLVVDIQAGGRVMKTFGTPGMPSNTRQNETLLATTDSPLGQIEIDVPDANRFRDADGWYHFVFEVEFPDPTVPIRDRAQWKFNEIKASLKGTSE